MTNNIQTNNSNIIPSPRGGKGGAIPFSKWVACWGNATSITDRREAVYAKDITLRYPVRIVFSGSMLRFRFSNLTGTEPVTITKASIGIKVQGKRDKTASCYAADAEQSYVSDFEPGYKSVAITFGGSRPVTIAPGKEIESDDIAVDIRAGETIEVSMYFTDYTQMNAGTLITGPLSRGQYAYGDFAEAETLPLDLSRKTNWFYFLNTIDILTEAHNHAVICYGDSITAQSWPDYLAIRCWQEGMHDVAIIRRAVSGTRILRQYDCITYQAYGLKGATRFPIEMNVAGASAVIIQHGINDIIHPVGTDVNPFRPWSDMPTLEDLKEGMENIYVKYVKQPHPTLPGGEGKKLPESDIKIYSGTLLPIEGWRTYNDERDTLRQQFNDWMRTSPLFDACIDFDKAVRDTANPKAFAPGFDSGDHLHPSEAAYKAMADCIDSKLLRGNS